MILQTYLDNVLQLLCRLRQQTPLLLIQLYLHRLHKTRPSPNCRKAQTALQILLPVTKWEDLMLIVHDSFTDRGRCCTDAVSCEAFGGDDVHGFRLGGRCDRLAFVRRERE